MAKTIYVSKANTQEHTCSNTRKLIFPTQLRGVPWLRWLIDYMIAKRLHIRIKYQWFWWQPANILVEGTGGVEPQTPRLQTLVPSHFRQTATFIP